jgi:hypothetical protein
MGCNKHIFAQVEREGSDARPGGWIPAAEAIDQRYIAIYIASSYNSDHRHWSGRRARQVLARFIPGVRIMAVEPIKAQLLTTCEVSSGGTCCRINFVDREGAAKTVEFPIWCLQQLTQTMRRIMSDAFASRYGNVPIERCHDVSSWEVARSPDRGGSVALTFTTPDGHVMTFQVPEAELIAVAEAVVEYELEAFPEGLGFRTTELRTRAR